MQTLISTARAAAGDDSITAKMLETPRVSINAGVAYIASQFNVTGFDPPKVACAYNAGGIYYNPSPNNRWKMRQYPIGTAHHADRFISFFNDCFCVIRAEAPAGMDAPSFAVEFGKLQGPA
jgi:soluble lytic murein transglycosylase-like protein